MLKGRNCKMSGEAIITRRDVPRTRVVELIEASDVINSGCNVKHVLPHGILISGDENQFESLRAKGYHVKVLSDTNILEVGAYRIDITNSPPKIPPKLEVPNELAKTWQHHLVQLIGPPLTEWILAIKEKDIDVVEPISSFGLFVVGHTKEVNALKQLPFVAWVGPFKPAYRLHPNLSGRIGKIQYVSIGVYPEDELDKVKTTLSKVNATIYREELPRKGYHGEYAKLIVEVYARSLTTLARLPGVRWLEYASPRPGYDGERETQIVSENLNAGGVPVPGYQAFLMGIGVNGAGVTIAICDSGVDANATNNADGHLDLRGRQTAFVDYTGGVATTDDNGHGTHVAGIAIGNAATGQMDAPAPNNFLWGQGVAPQADYVTQNATYVNQALTFGAPWPPIGGFGQLTQDAVTNGADVMNNSWWDLGGTGIGYTANARTFDQLVRDPNNTTAILDNLIIVFSAGNSGGDLTSITSPKEAKNIIVVGSSFTWRINVPSPSNDINGICHFSSRGPAIDTRILPNVVAPGHNVSSLWSETGDTGRYTPIAGTGTPDPTNPGNLLNQYLYNSGTSMSSPHVSGLCALLVEWWRNHTGGKNPSPAFLKALLINGGEDLHGSENWRRVRNFVLDNGNIYRRDNLNYVPDRIFQEDTTQLNQAVSLPNLNVAGEWFYDNVNDALYVWTTTNGNPNNGPQRINARDSQVLPHIPNNHQGWGRVSIRNILLQHPDSDRGNKIFSDQRHAFTANLQEYMIRIAPDDPTLSMRITLVWTDAPGAANASPALVNDLDLEVTELTTGNIYRGNVFANGFSTTGGNFDDRNNVECVYIENPSGTYEVRIIARNIVRNARPPYDTNTPWQDFALVIDNADVPSTTPVSIVPVIDRSGSMVSSGYVDITKTSSKQFVDLMGIDDRVAVVSFGSSGEVEYPTVASPTLQIINDPSVRDDVKTEIDSINFGGCTYMGEGVEKARDLLNLAPGKRAMVLLSDGYDNKGCDPNSTTRKWAKDVATSLPVDMPVYTCAIGPTSDQELLDQIATDTNGRYYYMPTIDDLFEIYNYVRGQVTGDSIIVNESLTASQSRVGAFVDSMVTEVTFSVAWVDSNIKFVARDPEENNEISVKLRDPRGHLLHSNSSHIRCAEGDGYVIFKLLEPMPGQWFIEVSTLGDTHVHYTVGGFVRSPIRIAIHLHPRHFASGTPLVIAAQIFDSDRLITGYHAKARVFSPSLSIKNLWRKFRRQLKDLDINQDFNGDKLPLDIAKLNYLRLNLLQSEKMDIFAPVSATLSLKNVTEHFLKRAGLEHLHVRDAIPTELRGSEVRDEASFTRGYITQPIRPTPFSGVTMTQFNNTKQSGSYNVIVTATGFSPISKTRFVRKELISVLVK